MEPETKPASGTRSSQWLLDLLSILGVVWLSSKLKPPSKQCKTSISPNNESAEKNDSIKNFPPLAAQVPQSAEGTETTCKCCQHKTPWWKILFDGSALLLGTLTLVALSLYACDTHRMWIEMQGQTKIAQAQLEMSERPWIITQYSVTAPLEFTPDGGATIEVMGEMKNIGHSVALFVHDTPLITIQESGVKMLRPTDDQKKACDLQRELGDKFPTMNSGDTLFPQDVSYEKMPLRFGKQDVDKGRIGKTDTLWGLVIIGCVDYRFSFSLKHHQTGYVYEIVKTMPNGQPGTLPIKIGERLDPKQLTIRRSLFGGFYAD